MFFLRKEKKRTVKRNSGLEALIFMVLFLAFFCALGSVMGAANMLNTMMHTAYSLLIDTVFYIMAVAVLAGALSALFSEFGVIAVVNKALSPLMMPLYRLPGAASLGIVTTYLSDNPAILSLANDKSFRRYFKKYQLPALTNIGTAFGMGFITASFMLGLPSKDNMLISVLVGTAGAVIGSIVSTRLMIRRCLKVYGPDEPCDPDAQSSPEATTDYRVVRSGGVGMRFIDAILEGGKSGVALGFDIIPGVLIICTVVMMLTNGPGPEGVYTGAAYEGVQFLPWLGEKLSFILTPLFGFSSPEAISVPITALGSAGASLGLIPSMVSSGAAGGGDVAVFTSMCMCWSGYLSTHVAMMSNLKASHLTGHAIFSHTIGGLCAGFSANWIYKLVMLIAG